MGTSAPAKAVVACAVVGGAGLVVFALLRKVKKRAAEERWQAALEYARQKKVVHQLEEQQKKLEEQLRDQQRSFEATIAALKRDGASPVQPPPPLYRVVLTGGPCGGKTTALSEIKARLEALGFLVLCVPEVATQLFSGGCPFPTDEQSAFTFQKNLLQLQIASEEAFVNLAIASGRKAMVLFDRGLMDGKAYMSATQWELMLEELKLTPVAMRDHRYDAILHLVTAADGAVSFYTLANNTVRTETPEQAMDMDRKTLDCWTGHEHLYIVDNSTGFDEKIRRAMARIFKLVGLPAPLAVTRKFLLERLPSVEEMRRGFKVEVFEVEQTYLAAHALNKNERARIRRRQQGSNVSFQHQLWINEEKVDADGRAYEETSLMERTLTAREYVDFLKQADPLRCTVSKTLTCFTWGNSYWELNAFKGAQHVAILEVEAESVHIQLKFPPMLQARPPHGRPCCSSPPSAASRPTRRVPCGLAAEACGTPPATACRLTPALAHASRPARHRAVECCPAQHRDATDAAPPNTATPQTLPRPALRRPTRPHPTLLATGDPRGDIREIV